MGQVGFDLAGMDGLAAAVRQVGGTLDALAEARFDDEALGGGDVAAACEELQTGWALQRELLVTRLELLGGFADAARQAAADVDAAVVTGEA